jgi:hypothetical protein
MCCIFGSKAASNISKSYFLAQFNLTYNLMIFNNSRCPSLVKRREKKRRLEELKIKADKEPPSFGLDIHSV